MSTDQKPNKLKRLSYQLLKTITLIVIMSLFMFSIAHFAISYGIYSQEISLFFQRTWFVWLLIRLSLYTLILIFIYQLYRRYDAIKRKILHRLSIPILLFIGVIEFINFTSLI